MKYSLLIASLFTASLVSAQYKVDKLKSSYNIEITNPTSQQLTDAPVSIQLPEGKIGRAHV